MIWPALIIIMIIIIVVFLVSIIIIIIIMVKPTAHKLIFSLSSTSSFFSMPITHRKVSLMIPNLFRLNLIFRVRERERGKNNELIMQIYDLQAQMLICKLGITLNL